MYAVIYDGSCNLCVTLVRLLEQLDQGRQFQYVPMQDETTLDRWAITSQDCEAGVILLDRQNPQRRWQGSNAAEEIGRLLPLGSFFVQAYRALPGAKSTGDQFYRFIRDHRYRLFGERSTLYESEYPGCVNDQCFKQP
ncbi:MAG: thiol-disulfide oxidoreductase DCC family protein [Leptolyngbyaceae cyanobacterium]